MIRKHARKRGLGEAGAAAAEFAVALPLLVILTAGILDYGGAVNLSAKLFAAARSGAQYAFLHPADTGGIAGVAQIATNDSSITVLPLSTVCKCINSATGAMGAPVGCLSSCGAGATLGHFVTITTQQDYTPILDLYGIGGPLTTAAGDPLQGAAVMQVQ